MLWKRRVGLRGLAVWYVVVAVALASIGEVTSSTGLQFAVLIGLILIGPTRDAVTVERHEPAVVVAIAIVAFAAVLAAVTGLTYVLADAFGVSARGALVLWVALVPATVAAGTGARRFRGRRLTPRSSADA